MRGRSSVELAAARRARAIRVDLGRDLARLREDAGLSRAAVARAAMLSASAVGRIETAAIEPDLDTLCAVGSVLGCELSIRLFPAGAPLHDRFQAPMVEAILEAADRGWERHLEVPVRGVVRGVIDVALAHPAEPLVVAGEIQSEIRRAEAVLRRSADKAEGLGSSSLVATRAERLGVAAVGVSRLLVIRSTTSTRAVVRDLSRSFETAYPARTADAVAAIRDVSRPWPGPAIVWVHLHGRAGTVMDGPPRGVPVGR